MRTVTFTDFRKRASGFITEVEHGETLVLLRRGKPVAEVVPFSDEALRSQPPLARTAALQSARRQGRA